MQYYVLILNPENKLHAEKLTKSEMIDYQYYSKGLVQKSLNSVT